MRVIFGALILLSSCATLNYNHSQNVKSFAKSAKTLSLSPGQLYQNISDYRHELKLIESSSLFSSEKVITRLNKILETKEKFDENAAQINSAAILIESYAECLLALTDESYDAEWKKQSDDLMIKLSLAVSTYNRMFKTPIPPSIGSFIGEVVNKVGSIKLHQLQKKYLKSFVDTGAFIINDVCDFFIETASLELESELNSLRTQFDHIMLSFYDKLLEFEEKRNVNPFNYLKDYNPLYLRMKERLNNLHSMQQKMVSSMKKIKATHEKLQVSVDTRMPDEIISEVKDLYSNANEFRAALIKLKN